MVKKMENHEKSEDTKLTPTGLISLIFFKSRQCPPSEPNNANKTFLESLKDALPSP